MVETAIAAQLVWAGLAWGFSCMDGAEGGGTCGAFVRGMSKHKGRVPELAKRTGAHGLVFVDVESGIYVGVGNDVECERTSSRGDASGERRSRPPGSPNSKLSRN